MSNKKEERGDYSAEREIGEREREGREEREIETDHWHHRERTAYTGKPKHIACFHDESANIVLARISRSSHSRTHDVVVMSKCDHSLKKQLLLRR